MKKRDRFMEILMAVLATLCIVAACVGSAFIVFRFAEFCNQPLEQKSVDNPNVIIEETNYIIDQFDDEIEISQPCEDPHESEKIEAALDWHYIEGCELTAYCPCESCCGCYALDRPGGIVYTASGAEAQADHTIAVDPDVIPLGSWVEIEIDGECYTYRAEDVGGGVNGDHIDIYFNDHDAAWDFGHRYADVRWYEGLEE